MKKIVIILNFVFIFLYITAQDTTYTGFWINSKKVEMDEDFEFRVVTDDSVYLINVIDSKYFIRPVITDSIFSIYVNYKEYELIFKDIKSSYNTFDLKTSFVIEDNKSPDIHYKTNLGKLKNNEYKYYYVLTVNKSEEELDEDAKKGFLYWELMSKPRISKKKRCKKKRKRKNYSKPRSV